MKQVGTAINKLELLGILWISLEQRGTQMNSMLELRTILFFKDKCFYYFTHSLKDETFSDPFLYFENDLFVVSIWI